MFIRRVLAVFGFSAVVVLTVLACGEDGPQPAAVVDESQAWFSLDSLRLDLSAANTYLCTTLSWNGAEKTPLYRRGRVRLEGPFPAPSADGVGEAQTAVTLTALRFLRVDPASRTKLREANRVIPDTPEARDFTLARFLNAGQAATVQLGGPTLQGWGGADEIVDCMYDPGLDRLECEDNVNCDAAGTYYQCENDCRIYGDPSDPYDQGGHFWCPGGGGEDPPPGEECDPDYEECCGEGDVEQNSVSPHGEYPNRQNAKKKKEKRAKRSGRRSPRVILARKDACCLSARRTGR